MSTSVASFERDVRTLIKSRHGIAISLTGVQVKGLLSAVNLPSGDSFMQKLRDCGRLRAIPAKLELHPRYGVDEIVKLVVELNGGEG